MTTSPAPAEAEAAKSPFGLNQAVLIALLAVGVFVLFRKFGLDGMISIALVAVGLGFVIFIHELGHFAVAKWCDVYVETFSIGFGPAIPGCSFKKGETLYKIAWFPLGGYVKMLGEGTESEEEDDNPRSFKNKSVWQRMAIISAGVIMNVILGFVCFIFVYETHGIERPLCAVGMLDVGTPAWVKGIPSGAVIDRIGNTESPYFDDLKYEVSLSGKDEYLTLVYHVPGEKGEREIRIKPRREKDDLYPVIGITPAFEPELLPKTVRKAMRIPVVRQSAAARALPAFDFGDKIVATTDPAHPAQLTPLPADDPVTAMTEFQRRLKLLAGKPMAMQVARQENEDSPVANVTIDVPPAYYCTLPGLRMQIGWITALREGSAAASELKARNVNE
ncbi:MAG TPA: site-2 protease family protein, partial [Gemmataceae bacterium]|nr:site-2 protease family protein [Gemmataceae bacterium]